MADDITAVVLAAGLSQRMGEENKLLMPINNEPMLRRTVGLLVRCDFQEVIVVLGHEREKTQGVLEGLDVKCVFNAQFMEGQMSSVQCGLGAVSDAADGVMIVLADQPMLCEGDIQLLIHEFELRGDKDVVMPEYQGQRGNPILISETVRQRVLTSAENIGCRRYIDTHPESVKRVSVESASFVSDLDTPDEYSAFCNSTAAANRAEQNS